MGCGCKKDRYQVRLPGGLTVSRATQAEAESFAKKSGGTVIKKPAA